MDNTPRPIRLLTLPEVAEMLRKTEASLRWMIQNGTAPPSAKIGGRRVFREHEVIQWVNDQFTEGDPHGPR